MGSGRISASLQKERIIFCRAFIIQARIDYVQREAHDLKLDELGDRILPVGALTAGAASRLGTSRYIQLHAGAQTAIYHVIDELASA